MKGMGKERDGRLRTRDQVRVQNEENPLSLLLTIDATRSIFRATVWAVRPDRRKQGKDEDFHTAVRGDTFLGNAQSQKSNNKIEQVEIGSTQALLPVFLPSFNLEHGAKPRRYRWMSTGIHGL